MRSTWSVPGARPMAVWSVAGRFGFAMLNLALLIYVERETGSYAVAGVVSAASLAGTAAGVLWQSRLIDRYGPTRVLLLFAGPYALLSAAVFGLIGNGMPALPVAALVAAQCAALPTVQVASRDMWRHLVPAGPPRDAAYGYEAVSFELCWLLGPAVAALLATSLWPGSALLVAVTLSAAGAVGFALTRAVRGVRAAAPAASPTGGAGVFRRAGLAVLLAAAAAFGFTIGFVVVGVTAGTQAHGVPQLAGVVLGLWSVSSVLGGSLYQRRPWPSAVTVRLPLLLAAFGALLLIPSLLDGVAALAAGVILAGVTLVPQITLHNTLLDGLVPEHRLSSAFGWVTTAIAVANAAGQAVGGLATQGFGYGAAFLTGAVSALAGAAVVFASRRTLRTA